MQIYKEEFVEFYVYERHNHNFTTLELRFLSSQPSILLPIL